MTDTTDRTGDISAILYGRLLERQRDAEAAHSQLLRERAHGATVLQADGVAEGLAIACEIVAGVPAGEVRADSIEANVARRADGIAHVDELRTVLDHQRHAPTVAVRAEQYRDRMDDDDYAAALRLAAADRAY